MPHAAHPYRQLFAQLVAGHNRALGAAPPVQTMNAVEVRVSAACEGVEFTLEHSLERCPEVMRMACRLGPLPSGSSGCRRALVRLLEIQHAIAMRNAMLSVDPAGGEAYHTVALPLARTDIQDLNRSMLLAHARALEWRDTRFLNIPGEEQVVAKGAELVLGGRTNAIVH
jgi:hypothetical protein